MMAQGLWMVCGTMVVLSFCFYLRNMLYQALYDLTIILFVILLSVVSFVIGDYPGLVLKYFNLVMYVLGIAGVECYALQVTLNKKCQRRFLNLHWQKGGFAVRKEIFKIIYRERSEYHRHRPNRGKSGDPPGHR